MKPRTWLRVAAILIAFNAIGHTMGGIPRTAQHGPAEQALFSAMQTLHFDFMGANRTHWDFYQGFGWVISVTLAALAVLTWQLGEMSQTAPAEARPLMITVLAAELLLGVLSWRYFFALAVVFSILTSLCLIIAIVGINRDESAAASQSVRSQGQTS